MGTKPVLIKSIMTDSKAKFTKELLEEIRNRIGKDATEEEAGAYLRSLSPEELSDLTIGIAMKHIVSDDTLSVLSGDGGSSDSDVDDDDDNSIYDDDAIYEGSGLLECMPTIDLKKYTLRIKLRGISPSIWRKIQVPSSVKLTSLAEIILDAMGWWNSHLHQFVSKGRRDIYRTAQKHGDDFFLTASHWGGDYSIAHLLQQPKDKVLFEYDFGDGWEHEVVLSKVEDYADGEKAEVHLLGGKRACPPEDCGGVWGYQELCEVMAHPYTTRAKELKQWLGYKFDPEDFDKEDTECILEGYNIEL